MSNWAQILTLPDALQRRILSIYNQQQQHFPIEIRKCLAEWIEAQDWAFYCNPNFQYDSTFVKKCILLVRTFAEKVNQLLSVTSDISDRFKVDTFRRTLQASLNQNNYEIIRHVFECLRSEQVIIGRFQEGLNERNPSHFHQLEVNCQKTSEKITYTEGLLKSINTLKENLILFHSKLNFLQSAQISTEYARQAKSIAEIQREIGHFYTVYTQYTEALLVAHGEIVQELDAILLALTCDLNSLKNNGSQFSDSDDNFGQIKDICQLLAANICSMWPQIKSMEALLCENRVENCIPDGHCREMKCKIIDLLKNLVNRAFIVVQQPCQVIKTNTKLKRICVNLLVGNIFKNNNMNPSVVKVNIISEKQAEQLYRDESNFQIHDSSGEILNSTTVMEYNQSSGILSANFFNLQLKKIRRTEKKASESVMDEKSAFLFTTDFFIEKDLRFSVRTISDPVVVIVHVYQEAHAQATITWDTAFAQPTRCPFEVPQEVKFGQLASVLSQKFYENTGRRLSETNIKFLGAKIFGNHVSDPLNSLVSWSRFAKEPLSGQIGFAFWDWFYAILKLTSEHLRDIWADDLVIGFATRSQAEEILRGQPAGTFFLRFSDSKLGGISIASVDANSGNVMMVEPFCANDLKLRKLPDRLRDFDQFVYLYPNIPKDDAFSRFYTKVKTDNQLVSNGYVRPVLLNYIPSTNGGGKADFGVKSQVEPNFPMDLPLAEVDFDGLDFEHQFSISSSNEGLFDEDI